MKIYRSLLSHGALGPVLPLLSRLDSLLLCAMHHRSSRDGVADLARADCFGAREVLAAVRSVKVNAAVERERARLLSRQDLLENVGPLDKGITVSAACAVSKSPRQAALLAALARAFSVQRVLELGTNVGISSAYLASAVDACLVTLEGSSSRASLAREVHANLQLRNVKYVIGLFVDTLDGALEEMPQVDMAFIDGHHQYRPTLDYFERIVQRAHPGSVFVFDDIRWSGGMNQAWEELAADERFGLVVDFWNFGACVLRVDGGAKVAAGPITCY